MGKLISLQALRAVAFIGIFLLHADAPVAWATLGVPVFFIMSGFLMMHIHYDADCNLTIRNSIDFSLKRIKKIYRLHIITMMCALVLSVASIIDNGFTIKSILDLVAEIFLNVTLLQTWVPYAYINVSLNGVAWYLSAAMFLYFVFPYICKWIKTKDNLISICVGIILTEIFLCWIWLHFVDYKNTSYIWFMYCFPVYRVGDFFIGCCLGKAYHNNKIIKLNKLSGTLIEIVALAFTIFILTFPHENMSSRLVQAMWNNTTLYMLPATIWVYLFACSKGLFTKIMTNKVLIYIGNISAYTYLIHYVITKYAERLIPYLNIKMEDFTMIAVISVEFMLTMIITVAYLKIAEPNRMRTR